MPPNPLEVRNVYATHLPSGDERGWIQCRGSMVVMPAVASQRRIDPGASRKNRRLGKEAHTPIVMPAVENTSDPSVARRTWSGAVPSVPPVAKVWTRAMYLPSGEKLRKKSSSSGLTPRPGTGGKVVSTRSPDAFTRCQPLSLRYVTDRPSGLTEYRPDAKPDAVLAMRLVALLARLALISCPAAVK